jgi:hypothetical protein
MHRILLLFLFLLLILPVMGRGAVVTGSEGVGATAAGDPVMVAGVDALGKVRRLRLETDGTLAVAASFASGAKIQLWDGVDTALVTAGGLLQVDASGAPIAVTGTFWQATQPVSLATTQRTPTITSHTADVTVAAGARKLTLIFSADFAGTVLGVAFAGTADASLTIDAPPGDTLAAVAVTRSAGTVRILKVQ